MKSELVRYEPNHPIGDANTLKALVSKPGTMQAMREIVPKHLTAERLSRIVLLAASRQPLLFKCTQASVLQSAMKAAELGVSCSGSLARGYLVPYWSNKIKSYEAQFIIGYGGLIDIICEPGGNVSHVSAEVVYEEDFFNLQLGTSNKLEHTPDPRGTREDDDIIGAYMIAWIRGGGHMIRYLPRAEIEKHKAKSAAKDKEGNIVGPWVTDYAAMCRKTPVRAGAQYLPLSKQQQEKIEQSDEPIDFGPGPTVTLQPTQGRERWDAFPEEPKDDPPSPNNPASGDQSGPPEATPSRRGRPVGSKNKPKQESTPEPSATSDAQPMPSGDLRTSTPEGLSQDTQAQPPLDGISDKGEEAVAFPSAHTGPMTDTDKRLYEWYDIVDTIVDQLIDKHDIPVHRKQDVRHEWGRQFKVDDAKQISDEHRREAVTYATSEAFVTALQQESIAPLTR